MVCACRASAPEHATAARACVACELRDQSRLPDPRLSAQEDHAAGSRVGPREFVFELFEQRFAADKWRTDLIVRRPPVREDLLVQPLRLIPGREIELPSQHVPADMKLAHGLVAPSC